MGIEIGVNMEFIRSEDKPFAAGLERAAQIGFRYVEPMVHNGRELLSEAGYFHSLSMDSEPLEAPLEVRARVRWMRRNVMELEASVAAADGEVLLEGEGRFVAQGRIE